MGEKKKGKKEKRVEKGRKIKGKPATEKTDICPSCKSTVFETDSSTGDKYCVKCGLVLDQ
jgi:acetyl-CoA carboxylase beta subunit